MPMADQGAAPFAFPSPPAPDPVSTPSPASVSRSLHSAHLATIFPAHSCAINGCSLHALRNADPAGSGAVRRLRCSSEEGYCKKRE